MCGCRPVEGGGEHRQGGDQAPPQLGGPVHQGFEVGMVAGAPARGAVEGVERAEQPPVPLPGRRGGRVGLFRGRDHQRLDGRLPLDPDRQPVVAGRQFERQRQVTRGEALAGELGLGDGGEGVEGDRPLLGRAGLVHDEAAGDRARRPVGGEAEFGGGRPAVPGDEDRLDRPAPGPDLAVGEGKGGLVGVVQADAEGAEDGQERLLGRVLRHARGVDVLDLDAAGPGKVAERGGRGRGGGLDHTVGLPAWQRLMVPRIGTWTQSGR